MDIFRKIEVIEEQRVVLIKKKVSQKDFFVYNHSIFYCVFGLLLMQCNITFRQHITSSQPSATFFKNTNRTSDVTPIPAKIRGRNA